MPLEERKRLCELAIGASAWLSVCPRGEFSSHTAASGIHDELHRECEGVLAGRTLTAVEIMGSDAAVRILNKILARSDGAPTRRTRTLCCVLRAGEDALFERRLLETDLIPRAARISIDVTLVDPGLADPPPKPVSSSQIMKLIERGQWDALRSGAWLHPSVLAALQQRFAWLSLEGSPEATSVD